MSIALGKTSFNMSLKNRDEDVVDLVELFSAIRARLWIAALFAICGIMFGMTVKREPVFQARAVFQHFDAFSQSKVAVGGQFIEQMKGTVFVDQVRDALSDAALSELGPNLVSNDGLAERDMFRSVFWQSVRFSRTPDELIEVVATHPSGVFAAELANVTAQTAVRVLAASQDDLAATWVAKASAEIAEAAIQRDKAQAALNDAVREGKNDRAVEASERDHALARARHDLLVQTYGVEAKALMVNARPVLTMVQEASVPAEPIPMGLAPSVVFGSLGLALGTLLSGVVGVASGRIYAAPTMRRLADASVNAEQDARSEKGEGETAAQPGYRLDEPAATEIMVAYRERAADLAVVIATDEEISALPAGLWLARRASAGGKGSTVIAFGHRVVGDKQRAKGSAQGAGGLLEVTQLADGTEILCPTDGFDFSLHNDDIVTAQTSETPANLVICCTTEWAGPVLRGLAARAPLVIAVTELGRTRRSTLEGLRRMAALDAMVLQRP